MVLPVCCENVPVICSDEEYDGVSAAHNDSITMNKTLMITMRALLFLFLLSNSIVHPSFYLH